MATTYIPPPTAFQRQKTAPKSPTKPKKPKMRRAKSAPVGTKKEREAEKRRARERWQQAIFRAAALHREDSLKGLRGGRRRTRKKRGGTTCPPPGVPSMAHWRPAVCDGDKNIEKCCPPNNTCRDDKCVPPASALSPRARIARAKARARAAQLARTRARLRALRGSGKTRRRRKRRRKTRRRRKHRSRKSRKRHKKSRRSRRSRRMRGGEVLPLEDHSSYHQYMSSNELKLSGTAKELIIILKEKMLV